MAEIDETTNPEYLAWSKWRASGAVWSRFGVSSEREKDVALAYVEHRLAARDLAIGELVKAAERVLEYLPDANDAKNYAATNDGRASSYHVDSLRLRESLLAYSAVSNG